MLRENANEQIVIMLLGNKIDLSEKRVITTEQGIEFAKENRLGFYETSAKEGVNVNEAIERLTLGNCAFYIFFKLEIF